MNRPLTFVSSCFFALSLLCCDAALIDDMGAAKEAARTGNSQKLTVLAEKIDGSALEMYPHYWLLAAQLTPIDKHPDAEIQAFLQRYAGSYLADRLRGDWLRALGHRNDWDRFEAEWPKLINWDIGSDLHCYRLQLAAVRKDLTSLQEARSLWFNDKGLPDPCSAVFDAMLDNGILDQSDVWMRLRMALQAGNTDLALALLPRLAHSEGMDAKRIKEAQAKPSKVLGGLNLASRGGRELALFIIGRAGKSDSSAGLALLELVANKLPDPDRKYAYTRLGFHAAHRQSPDALSLFKRGLDTGLSPDEADWRIRAALRAGDWMAVANYIDALPAERQKESAWRYWRGRAALQAGDIGLANRLFVDVSGEHTFYGLMSREELDPVADVTAGHYRPSNDELQAVRQMPGVERALALQAMEWRPEGSKEWNFSMRGLNDRQLLAAAELARQANWFDRAIYSAERTKEIHDFSLRYLSPYRDITRVYAKQLDLDDAWVYGLIRQESRFVVVAKSGVGASGLMQLMPATAKWVARKIGLKLDNTGVNEIGTNVQLGTFYLKHVLEGLGNQPVLATAAYNAGPGRARAWQGNLPIEGAIYAETIPFNETRDYVKKVMANAVYYALAFGKGDTSIKHRMGVIPPRGSSEIIEDGTP